MLTREHPWIAKYWLCHFCHGLNGGYLGFFDPQWKINRNLQVFKRFPKKKSRKTKKNGKRIEKNAKLRKKKTFRLEITVQIQLRKKNVPVRKRSKSVRKPFETVRHYAKFYVKRKTFQDPNHAVPKVTWTTLGKLDSKH